MDIASAIENRRSIRKFDPDHIMSQQEEDRLIQLAMLSPTAFNIQHWRFVLVKDRGLRQQIREVAWNQAQVTDASLLVVLCADLKAWRKDPVRYWRNASREVQDFMVPAIHQYYGEHAQFQRDECMRSCGLAAQTLMLAAQGMGYDSCPMDGFDFDAVGRLIQLPDDHIITLFVVIGKRLQPAFARGGQLAMDEVRIVDRFDR
ncbi:MAG: nitroreductase family protein [Magnetococcales bacterium]|nr:nitroreductase family protein [Magnetococcales bacterium]